MQNTSFLPINDYQRSLKTQCLTLRPGRPAYMTWSFFNPSLRHDTPGCLKGLKFPLHFFPSGSLHWLLSCWTKTSHTAAAVVNKCLTESKQKKSVFAPRGLWKHFLSAPFHKHSYIDINAMDGCFEKVNTLEITKVKIDINYDTWCWHHDSYVRFWWFEFYPSKF